MIRSCAAIIILLTSLQGILTPSNRIEIDGRCSAGRWGLLFGLTTPSSAAVPPSSVLLCCRARKPIRGAHSPEAPSPGFPPAASLCRAGGLRARTSSPFSPWHPLKAGGLTLRDPSCYLLSPVSALHKHVKYHKAKPQGMFILEQQVKAKQLLQCFSATRQQMLILNERCLCESSSTIYII